MKNLIKIALITLVFTVVSCSTTEEEKDFKAVSIAKIAEITPEFSDFSRSLDSLGLTSTFENDGDFTVFVPTNDAMLTAANNLGYAKLDSIFKYPTAKDSLRDILRYHTISSRALSTSLTNNQDVTSLYGQTFKVTIAPVLPADVTYAGETNKVTLNGNNPSNPTTAEVIARDVICTNGVIHPVNGVLIPNFSPTGN
ncbi:MAG: fasciclin domain-containing protein [Flavobacterium sp. JAD_PAG50586_2]|nr:MAG: fasciclin domain-containing protein [Flavobacterium sp. JAD_PAG50586_2]